MSDLLLFAPVGFVVVMALSERGRSAGRRGRVAAIGAACAFARSCAWTFGQSIRWERPRPTRWRWGGGLVGKAPARLAVANPAR